MHRAAVALLFALSLAVPMASTGAQTIGSAVPPFQAPPKAAAPERPTEVLQPEAGANRLTAQPETLANFRDAYIARGKPRLALFWNREFSDQLDEWYSPLRVVERNEVAGSLDGAVNATGSASLKRTAEVQVRNPAANRPRTTERWAWAFQDGFLAPFLEAGAQVIDRATVVRMTAAGGAAGAEPAVIEAKALEGKADYILEALVTPSTLSRTGFEMRARVIDIKTGAIAASVNSRGSKEWNPAKRFVATEHGFVDPDPDDVMVGPESDPKVRASAHGITVSRKPPKLEVVANTLAYHVMAALAGQWKQ